MIKVLSYPLRVGDPGWPGNPTFEFEQYTSTDNGDIANQYQLHLLNHFGSHMDGPNHFNPNGIMLYEVPVERFVYHSVLLIDVDVAPEALIALTHLEPHLETIQQADLILFRSHFSQYRATDPTVYSAHGPGISAEVSKYLVESCPNLKAIGMDWISLASYQHQQDGHLSHQYLLGKFHDRYILIIEDLNLEAVQTDEINLLIALPLRVEGIDSAPCTVIALCEPA